MLATALVMSLITACGGKKEEAPVPATTAETKVETADTAENEEPVEEEEVVAESTDTNVEDTEEVTDTTDESSDGLSLMDVTADRIKTGVYGMSEDGQELVFTIFNDPEGIAYAALIAVDNNDTSNSDLICGQYENESFTDEDGVDWTKLIVTDVYTGNTYNFGFAEKDDEVVFFNAAGDVVEGRYLDADETVTYLGSAIAVAQ